MVKGKCLAPECDFIVEDGQHIDDVCQKLREHWRAQHPARFFSHNRHGERAAVYNMEWDDILVAHFGADYANAGVDPENERYFLSDITHSNQHNPEVVARATELLAAYNARVQADGVNAAPGRARAFGGRRPRIDAGPPMAAPAAFLPPLEFVDEADDFDDV